LLQKWLEYMGDKDIGKITAADITEYLNWLRTDTTPHRFSGKKRAIVAQNLNPVLAWEV
jgi:hypothetical protein